MEIKVNTVSIAALVYMYLGVVVFFIGWLKPGYALAACLILGAGFLVGARSWCKAGADDKVHLSKGTLLMGAALILFFVWHTGIGAFTGQAGDWAKHNAVMHDLIEKDWPVMYRTAYGESMLSYYTGFYLCPALAGKAFGSFRAAEWMQYAMAAIGIFLLWLLLIRIGKVKKGKWQLLCLALLFFFGGLLPLGQAVCGSIYPENFPFGSHEWMNPETVRIQYTSNWSLLKWVPEQAIVPWLATSLLLLKPWKTENYMLIGFPVIWYSGFAMIGLAALMLPLYLYDGVKSGWKRLGKAFSISNLLFAVLSGIPVLYFWGNISGEKPEYLGFHWLDYGGKPGFYILFCFFMFGFYAILLFKENRKNIVYWISVTALLIYPRFAMGLYNDFTMRASIPALFMLLALILRFFSEGNGQEQDKNVVIRKTLLAAGLVVGMIYPLMNLRESIVKNQIGAVYRTESSMSLEPLADPSDGEIPDDFKYNYYTYHLEKDIFYQYLAK